MGYAVVLSGALEAFSAAFSDIVRECGYAVRQGGQGDFRVSPEVDDLSIVGVARKEDLPGTGGGAKRPFLVYTALALSQEEALGLREAGLIGVIAPATAPEEVAFLLNKALFFDKMIRRNPRAPVSIPVTLGCAPVVIRSFATLLSRDGIFVVSLNPLAVNSACTLRFPLPGAQRELSTGAKVIYNIQVNRDLSIISNPRDPFKRLVSHPGMALVFTDMPHEDRDLIESYIETIF